MWRISATFTPAVESAANRWTSDSRRHIIKVDGSSAKISDKIEQVVHLCAEHKKVKKLVKFLEKIERKERGQRQASRVLIFVKNIKTCIFLSKYIKDHYKPAESEEGGLAGGDRFKGSAGDGTPTAFRCALLHGKLPQHVREKTLSEFKVSAVLYSMMVSTPLSLL